jgi:hypothetical protein
MNRAEGSRAPNGLFRGEPPCIPGKPRPTVKRVLLLDGIFGAKRLVVGGVIIFAGRPLVWGAPIDGTGEITAGTCCGCWIGSSPGAFWADNNVDHPPKRQNPVARNSLLREISGRDGKFGAIFCAY